MYNPFSHDEGTETGSVLTTKSNDITKITDSRQRTTGSTWQQSLEGKQMEAPPSPQLTAWRVPRLQGRQEKLK